LTLIDYAPFSQLHKYMEQAFSLIYSNLEKKIINNYVLLYIWKGTGRKEWELRKVVENP